MRTRLALVMTALLTLPTLASCAFETVKPWQRDELARDNAQLIGDAMESSMDEHIYFSKEAASGGLGVTGGGCGCN